MFELSEDILRLIYSYDVTYHEKYRSVLEHLEDYFEHLSEQENSCGKKVILLMQLKNVQQVWL